MRGRLVAVLGATVAVAAALGAALWVELRGPRRSLGETATPFVLPVVAGEGAAEGDRVSLEALRGRVVLLDFWATWCEPCAELAPRLSALRGQREGEGLTVLGVIADPGVSASDIRAAHHRFGADYPSVEAPLAMLDAYGVRGFPTVLLLDRRGRLIRRWDGVADFAEIRRAVDGALATPPPDSPES